MLTLPAGISVLRDVRLLHGATSWATAENVGAQPSVLATPTAAAADDAAVAWSSPGTGWRAAAGDAAPRERTAEAAAALSRVLRPNSGISA